MSVRPFLWLSGSAQGSRTGGRVRYHGRTTTRGFKSNREVRAAFVTTRANGSFFYGFFKDYKPEVRSHNSFESRLCGMLIKEPTRYS